ncbi:M28 family peptidase [Pendulispora rubella]|uniref:Carboxypeptidase Q n=1 Tax=Pendulispora rubella TaxID=2741070 RepID=A0ABZ2L4P4_9BACT
MRTLAIFAVLALAACASTTPPKTVPTESLAANAKADAKPAAPPVDENDPRVVLKRHFEGETPMMADLSELCDGIGGRVTGSPAAARAVKWAAEKLRTIGVDEVRTESFRMPFLWLPDRAEATATAPESFAIPTVASPGTASMPAAVEAPLLDAGHGTAEDFAKLGARAKGAFVLIHTDETKTFEELFAEYMRSPGIVAEATKARVAGLVLQSTRPRGLLYEHPLSIGRTPLALTSVMIAREHAERLGRLAGRSQVRLRVKVINRVGPSYESQNVIGEVRGSEKPDEVVLLGAHLDSWGLGTGAEDNGINSALVLDVARAFHQLGLKPRRTVRFALFMGEEQGMRGSTGYVERHRAEMPNHTAALVFDIGSGHTTGFFLNGREELRGPVTKALSIFPEIAADAHPADALDGTDNWAFLLSGVPNLVAMQDPAPYLPDYHAQSDVVDRVNAKEAKRNAALAAATIWWLANTNDTLPKQQNRAEVDALLVQTKLVDQMKAFDQWHDWEQRIIGFPAGENRPSP